TTGLLQSMQTELAKVEWIAISLSPRRGGISDSQLSRYPKLKAYIDSVIFTGKARTRKAGYQPVVDDVVLAREYTHVPVEPSPEHKIVVEFAGQWSSSAACLLLSKTDNQHEKITAPAADKENAHRSLATFKGLEPEGKTLYIKIPCKDQPMPILLKLAEKIEPVEKDTKMTEWDNVLVPVLPLCYSGDAWSPFTTGRVYVLLNGELWRELEVLETGYFSDVDFSYSRDKPKQTRHVNIEGSELFPEDNVSFERFAILQNGAEVYQGVLDVNQQERVFGFTEEEVDIKFLDFDHDTITLPTVLSPLKAQAGSSEEVQGFPQQHIWVPYKIQGDTQEVYLYYSSSCLSDEQVSELESNYTTMAISLEEMSEYSNSQAFSNDTVFAVPPIEKNRQGQAMVNAQVDCNVAAVSVPLQGGDITLRYRVVPSVDQPDDHFMLQNEEHNWSQKAYFRSAKVDEEGFLNLRFNGWPAEVKEVDIIRVSHSSRGTGSSESIPLRTKVKITDLLG
ncbi:hypothetical protein, partial [Vibrio azureus]